VRFFSGGHPLSIYISKKLRAFPLIDTSGGNVTYASFSLAQHLGAKEIIFFGDDFSYPEGKIYTRGAYIYPFFNARRWRLKPSETLLSDFLFNNPSIKKTSTEISWRYETRTLKMYKNMLCAKIIEAQKNRSQNSMIKIFAAGPALMDTDVFLIDYKQKIKALPEINGSIADYLFSLSKDEVLILATLLPSAAAIKHRNPSLPLKELFEKTKEDCIRVINLILQN
jgi:hypothetical protein